MEPLAHALGITGIVLGLSKVHAALIAEPAYDFSDSSRLRWALLYAVVLWLAAWVAGIPDRFERWRDAVLPAIASAAAGALILATLTAAAGTALLPRFVLVLAPLGAVVWSLVVVRTSAIWFRPTSGVPQVVVVGEPDVVAVLLEELASSPERPVTVVGVVDREEALLDPDVVARAVADHRATMLVLDSVAQDDEGIVAVAETLHRTGVRIRWTVSFAEEFGGVLPLDVVERSAMLFDIAELHGAGYSRLKRVLDVVIALAVVPLLLVVAAVSLVLNPVLNRGPLLYHQLRVGRDGREFDIWKLRTMTVSEGPSTWTTADDARITRWGGLLRKLHLDELPQVINILRGDLSIVGPRPEQPSYVALLLEEVPHYGTRHLVRPGLTGWAQVKFPYGADVDDARRKLQYDLYYLRNQRLGTDLRILARTARAAVFGGGR